MQMWKQSFRAILYDKQFFVSNIIVFAFLVYTINHGIQYSGYRACAMDFFAYSSYREGVYILPFSSVLIVCACRQEMGVQFVIRHKNLQSVWLHLCIKCAVLAVVISMTLVVLLGLFGKLYPTYCWESRSGMMFRYIAHVLKEYSYPRLVVEFFLVTAFNIWFAAGIALLLYWILGNPLLGLIPSVSVPVALDKCQSFFFNKLHLTYGELYAGGYYEWKIRTYLLMTVLLLAAGAVLVRRREFLKNHDSR